MSLHKLTAGDGYTYLTRQVAASDATERGYSSLGDYYSAKGESPGHWAGRGLRTLGVSGVVTEQQMRNLFGEGLHPDADRIETELLSRHPDPNDRARVSAAEILRRTQLGRRFPIYQVTGDWRSRLSDAYAVFNTGRGAAVNQPIDPADRQRIRTGLATTMFAETHHRAPASPQELSGFLAQTSRPEASAVAGFDLTFSPVKSVSTLWAVAPRTIAEQIEAAHNAAVDRTMSWLEEQVGYTRVGPRGRAQVETSGLVTARFTHRDARSGDPDLHTHVAVSSKVQTLDGRWLALDARMLYRYNVAGSEHYNTALEEELTTRLGVSFTERPTQPGKRPIREVVGVDERLNQRWSTRRQHIDTARAALTAQFVRDHGRVPTTVEMIDLAQQANLSTRDHKHEPRSLHEQRSTWHTEAVAVLGESGLQAILDNALATTASAASEAVTPDLIGRLAAATTAAVADSRAHWRESNVLAEALRQVRATPVEPAARVDLAHRVTTAVLTSTSTVQVGLKPADPAPPPAALLRSDGTSVFTTVRGALYTSTAVVDAETRIVNTAGLTDGRRLPLEAVRLAERTWSARNRGRTLNHGQAALVREVATSGRRVQLALAPAGSGKTTVMGVLAAAWQSNGGHVVGLAPQASAAQQLADAAPSVTSDTLDKLLHELRHTPTADQPPWIARIGTESLVIIDEAGLASTPKLDTAISYITGRGGRVLLVGDDQQRAAIGAGGVLRDIEATHGAVTLTEILRFTDPSAGQVSLALRAGDPSVAGYYADHHLIHAVTPDTAAHTVFQAWAADTAAGIDSIMIAPTLDMVTALNAQARNARIATITEPGPEAELPNGERICAGDVILTKRNNRALNLGGTDFVKNNYRWTATAVHPDGSITATEIRRQLTRTLPAWYLQQGHVRLGYAHTSASVQGMTVGVAHQKKGTAHAVITAAMTRNDLYPALTRAVDGTHAYVILGGDGDTHDVIKPDSITPPTALEILRAVITRDGTAQSTTTLIRNDNDPRAELNAAADAYLHSVVAGAETVVGPERVQQFTDNAEAAAPGVTTTSAWDTLRGHLVVLEAGGAETVNDLQEAVDARPLDGARNIAAVLDWRLDPTGNHSQQPGPLPWLPAIPEALRNLPDWSTYLSARATRIVELAAAVTDTADHWTVHDAPRWAMPYLTDRQLVRDLAVWRAAEAVPDDDLRPAGDTPHRIAMQQRHHTLVRRALHIAGDPTDGADHWVTLLRGVGANVVCDNDYWPVLAGRLALAAKAGLPVPALLTAALTERALPSEESAAALWWRLAPHLGDTTTSAGDGYRELPGWTDVLTDVLGKTTGERITSDRLWPTIVARMDRPERDGATPTDVVMAAAELLNAARDTIRDHELAVVLHWHITTLLDDAPVEPGTEPHPDPAQADLQPDDHEPIDQTAPNVDGQRVTETHADPESGDDYYLNLTEPDPADAEPEPESHDDDELATSSARIYAILETAGEFYRAAAATSWVPEYLQNRNLRGMAAGYAPAGWTTTLNHLRGRGFIDTDILAAGLARTSRNGTLIDHFRNRVMLPITTADGHIAGFIGRKAPDDTDHRNPKYLNSPATDVFDKSRLLYGLDPAAVAKLRDGANLLITEGPFDQAATQAAVEGENTVVVAPLGTALTAGQLNSLNDVAALKERNVALIMDNDDAGRAASLRAYPLLAARGVAPELIHIDGGKDPAEIMEVAGGEALRNAIAGRTPLIDVVVDHTVSQWQHLDTIIEHRVGALREVAPTMTTVGINERLRQSERLARKLKIEPFEVLDSIDRHRQPTQHPADNELAQRWRDEQRSSGRMAAFAALIREQWSASPEVAEQTIASARFADAARQLHTAERRGIDLADLIAAARDGAAGTNDPATYLGSTATDHARNWQVTQPIRDAAVEVLRVTWKENQDLVHRLVNHPSFDNLAAALATSRHSIPNPDMLLASIAAKSVQDATDPIGYMTYRLREVQRSADPEPLSAVHGAEAVLRQLWADHPRLADQVIKSSSFGAIADHMAAAEQRGIDVSRLLGRSRPGIIDASVRAETADAVIHTLAWAVEHAAPSVSAQLGPINQPLEPAAGEIRLDPSPISKSAEVLSQQQL